MNSENISKNEKLKSQVDFKNLKSNNILQKIFKNMKTYKKLEIMKYNKQLQKRLNLTIND